MELYSRLSSLRKAKGLSQEELAEKLGVSRQAISKWENGLSSPEMAQLPKLCEIFEVTPNELFGYEAPEEDKQTVVVSAPQRPWYKVLLIVIAGILGANLIAVAIPMAVGLVVSYVEEVENRENIKILGNVSKSFDIIGREVVGNSRVVEIEFTPAVTESYFDYYVGLIDADGNATEYRAEKKAGVCRAKIMLPLSYGQSQTVTAIIKERKSGNVLGSDHLATIEFVDEISIAWK